MATYETKMAIGQAFWTIESRERWNGGKTVVHRKVKEHEVEEIRIDGNEQGDVYYVYDILYDECYSAFRDEAIGTSIFLTKEDAELAMNLTESAEE